MIDHAAPRIPLADLLSRLDTAREHGLVLASDADNTIWDGDVGDDLYAALLAARGVREAAREALAAEAREFGVDATGDATAIATALLHAFEAKRYPADRNYAMVAWVFAGWHEDEVAEFSARVLDEVRIDARIRPEMRAVRRWADENDVPFYVVSASPMAVVRAGVARLGVGPEHIAAMTPELDAAGVLQPRLSGPIVYGDGKLHALEALRPNASLLGAFGDSPYDAPMLRASRVPVAVTPSVDLVDLLPSIPRVVVLDR